MIGAFYLFLGRSFESSEENEFSKGISILKGKVKHLSKFGNIKTIPHVGWNIVKLQKKK